MTTMIDEQLVARRIRDALMRAGLTATDAAGALGVTRRAVEHWMSGQRRPRAQLLIALSELVTMSPAWLMGRDR